MTLNSFCIYIACLLTFAFAFMATARRLCEGLSENKNEPALFGLFSSLSASVIAFLASWISTHLFIVFWILAAIFLLFGAIQVGMVHRKYFYCHQHNGFRVLVGEFCFALSIVLFTVMTYSSLLYFLKDRSFLFYPMAWSGLAYLLPVAGFQAYEAARDIPAAQFPAWLYPEEPIELPEETANERLLVIGFEIAKVPSDAQRSFFRARAPEKMLLGDLFFHFINDYNELQSETPINYRDAEDQAFEWWFQKKSKWYCPQQIYDPRLSVKENGIQENTVIICERLPN